MGSTASQKQILEYHIWFRVEIHFSLWWLPAILDLCKLSMRIIKDVK